MKVCPTCGTTYTDDTLQYCLQDGARLKGRDVTESRSGVDELDTVVRQRPVESPAPIVRSRSRMGLIVAAASVAVLILLSLGGIAAWLIFFRNSDVGTSNQNAVITNVSPVPTKSPSPSPTPTPAPANNANVVSNANNNTPSDPAATERERREITQFVAQWKSDTEGKDIDSYIGKYANTVAYYNNPSATREQVRRDKQRAFSIYDHIRIDLSNVNMKIDPDGENASVTFDKEWEFVGGSESRGKVRSELRLKKVSGDWRITGERDQKVYYVK
jgi:uncharacterized membrane protein YvbJ